MPDETNQVKENKVMSESFILDQLNSVINLLRKKMEGYRDEIETLKKENYALTKQRMFIVVECYDSSHTQLPLHKTGFATYGVAVFKTIDEAKHFVGNLIDHEGIDWSFKDSPYDSWKAIGRSDKGRKFVVVECIN